MYADIDPTQDTEFHDALRARGIIPALPPSRSPSPERESDAQLRATRLAGLSDAQIRAALDDAADARDADAERELEALRARRAEVLARERRTHRFGRVYPIGRPDYTREVTDASKAQPGVEGADEEQEDDDEGMTGAGPVGGQEAKETKKGTGVVCFLYKDGMDTCQLLAGYLNTLAAKYPATKFVSIVGDKCIPNYPDKNLPTLLIYRNGALHRQIIGLRPEIGCDGMKTKCEDIELLLTAVGVLDRSEVPGEPTHIDSQFGRRTDEHDNGDEEPGRKSAIRGGEKTQEEIDAELDWDL